MDLKGMCTMWFMHTTADKQWNGLHQILQNDYSEPAGNEAQKALACQKLVCENPHIINGFFETRAQDLLKTVFVKKGLEMKWSWFHVEYHK